MKIIIGEAPQHTTCKNTKEVYDVIRVEYGIPLFIEDHFNRLKSGLLNLNVGHLFNHQKIKHGVYVIITEEKIIAQNVKISCLINDNECNYYIYSLPTNYISKDYYQQGVPTILFNAERKLPNIKIAHTKVRTSANTEIDKNEVFEALLVNHNSEITEGSRSNVFFIKDQHIITAPDNAVLPGIIRCKTIEIIKKKRYSLTLASLKVSDLSSIDAVFITGTSPRILPVNRIDSFKFVAQHPLVLELLAELNLVIKEYIKNADTL